MAFLADLQTCDFTTLLDHIWHGDPNQNYDKLHQKLSELKCKHLPWKLVKFNKYRHKNNRWITHGVIKSIKYRDKLDRNLKNASKDSISYVELKNRLGVYNKILKKAIREAKYIYYNRQFEEIRTNVRKTWSIMNEIISWTKNKKGGIKSIIKDGRQIRDLSQIVENFDEFFVNIGPNLSRNTNCRIGKSFQTYLNRHIVTCLHFKLINERDTEKCIRSLRIKTSSGHDGISTKLLKFLSPGLIKPLTLIINQSLITGIFPEKLKLAKMIPLYKKDDKLIMNNYIVLDIHERHTECQSSI